MIKKILIILAIVIPTVILSFILVSNKSHLGSDKNFEKREYMVEGMTCTDCEIRLKQILNGDHISVEKVDFETKRIIMHIDPQNTSLNQINTQLLEHNYSLKLPAKGSLKVLDYQIKVN